MSLGVSDIAWVARWMNAKAQGTRIAFIVCSGVTAFVDPLLVKFVIDVAVPRNDVRAAILAAAGVLAVYLARTVFNSLGELSAARAQEGMLLRLRLALLRRIQATTGEWFDNSDPGSVMFCAVHEIEEICDLSSAIVGALARTIVITTITMTAMLVLNARLAVVMLLLSPVFVYVCRVNRRAVSSLGDTAQRESSTVASCLQELVSNALHIQLLGASTRRIRDFLEYARTAKQARLTRYSAELWYTSSYLAIIALAVSSTLAIGSLLIFRKALSVGGLIAFYSFLARFFDPLATVVDIDTRLHRLLVTARRVRCQLERIPYSRRGPLVVINKSDSLVSISCEDVWFAYTAGRYIIRSLSFSVGPVEIVALRGRSGCGKSTTVKLLAGVYSASRGRIRINGTEVGTVSIRALRKVVFLVAQDPVLLGGSLRDNLLLAKPTANHRELEHVAEMTCMDEVLARLPHGWEEPVTGLTVRLSRGERQRLALAQAVLRNPRVLILDESLNSLDAERETSVLNRLRPFFTGRLVIMISHRPAATLQAHRVLHFDGGQIVSDCAGRSEWNRGEDDVIRCSQM